jgi:putative endonuclease
MKSSVEKGKYAEDVAANYLESNGLTVIDRNYRFMKSEVDIVAYQGNEVVFVEVRSLKSEVFGRPEETISLAKQKQVFQAAEAWLYEKRMEGARVRFDVVSVLTNYDDSEPEITHFRNAFWY